jgi:hypothetical protein
MVRIFRISLSYHSKTNHQWFYQSEAQFKKQWDRKIKSLWNKLIDDSIEFIAEEVIDGQWVEIDRWDNGK